MNERPLDPPDNDIDYLQEEEFIERARQDPIDDFFEKERKSLHDIVDSLLKMELQEEPSELNKQLIANATRLLT